MPHDFDTHFARRDSDSVKWNLYGADVLPLWIAEADFKPPQAVTDALAARVAHGIFGYTAAIGHASAPGAGWELPEIGVVIVERMRRLYDWDITTDDLVYLPGVVAGFNVACRSVGQIGDAVLMHAPCYGPIAKSPGNQGRQSQFALLREGLDANGLRTYRHDDDAFGAAMDAQTRLFLLCNQHNPTGRAFDREELTAMADRCIANDVVICSDEIHCELMLGDATHIPIATLSPQIAQQTITLMSPSKTFNIPGLGFCVAIIQNPVLRAQYVAAMQGLVASPQIFGYTGALAAYQHGDEWLREVLEYYQANREYAIGFIRQYMPQLIPNRAEATYLLWIDCRQANLPTNPKEMFLSHAKVALGDGSAFGAAGDGYIRLTFATQRSVLQQALEAMYVALQPYS